MLVFAVLLVAVAVVLGFYAQANQGSHDVTVFGTSWHTWDWVPAALAAGAVAVLLVGAMVYAMVRIGSLRRANARLREEVALLNQDRAASDQAAARDVVGGPERVDVAPTDRPALDRERAVAPPEPQQVPAAFRMPEPPSERAAP